MNEVVPQILPLRDSQPVDTSGTVGSTIIDAMSIIESAARRCGVQPTALTPENLDTGRNNLFMILARLATRGLNLWAVEQFYLSTVPGKGRYDLPSGTEGIAGIMYRVPTRLPTANVLQGSQYCTATLDSAVDVVTIGFNLPADLATCLAIESSQDGVNWSMVEDFGSVTLTAGWHWYTLATATNCIAMRLRDTTDNAITCLDMVLANQVEDLPLTQYNRDQYTVLNNKFQQGRPTVYYFEKKIESAINFWPVPNTDTSHFMLWRFRAIQDIGSFMNKIEVPDRWLDGITWMLSKNLGFELPGVDPVRLQLCIQEAQNAEEYAELGEDDGSPTYIQPNIRGYTA